MNTHFSIEKDNMNADAEDIAIVALRIEMPFLVPETPVNQCFSNIIICELLNQALTSAQIQHGHFVSCGGLPAFMGLCRVKGDWRKPVEVLKDVLKRVNMRGFAQIAHFCTMEAFWRTDYSAKSLEPFPQIDFEDFSQRSLKEGLATLYVLQTALETVREGEESQ